MIDKVRELALKTLYQIDAENAYSNIILDKIINENRKQLTDKDLGLISELVYGVTTWKLTLDTIIKKYSKIRLKKISLWIINILRMGVYQIIFLDKIPKSAAVNESVNLAKRYGHSSSANFVNAILRKVEKVDYEELFLKLNNTNTIQKQSTESTNLTQEQSLSVIFSMPEWIVKKLIEEYGLEIAKEICKNSNLKPKTTIRINNLKTNKEELKKLLEERNIEYKETDLMDFLILNKIKNIENLDLFKKGYFTVQDISAGLTAIVLNPNPNDKVLDACAAPGGKTTYMAELMRNKGQIEAWDIYEHRTELIKQNAERLGINTIKTTIQDATVFDESKIEKFDRILLDVPCLGIGVIKRKPDIKWSRQTEDIEKITKIQQQILENCSKYLKKGGYLVYSTCSIFKEENEKNVEKFLQNNYNFKIIPIDKNKISIFFLKNKQFLNILPDEEKDGFFICKLQKM